MEWDCRASPLDPSLPAAGLSAFFAAEGSCLSEGDLEFVSPGLEAPGSDPGDLDLDCGSLVSLGELDLDLGSLAGDLDLGSFGEDGDDLESLDPGVLAFASSNLGVLALSDAGAFDFPLAPVSGFSPCLPFCGVGGLDLSSAPAFGFPAPSLSFFGFAVAPLSFLGLAPFLSSAPALGFPTASLSFLGFLAASLSFLGEGAFDLLSPPGLGLPAASLASLGELEGFFWQAAAALLRMCPTYRTNGKSY